MAERRTRVTLSVPWDDELLDHPLNWDWDFLLATPVDQHGIGVLIVTTEEVATDGTVTG